MQEGSHLLKLFFFKLKILFPLLQLYNKLLKRENDSCRYKEAIDCCKEIERAV